MITQTFDLNLIPEQAPVVVHCDQYDKGTGRLIVKLYEGDTAYTPVGSAVIQGCKPDGHGFQYNATLSGNTVTANLTEQMTAVAGHVRCQIVVTETTGRTGTFVFILEVQKSALPSNTDMSDSEYQLIEQAIEDAQQAVEDSRDAAEDAEAWAVGERGGVPVGPTDPTYHNNSYYWSQQAQSVEDLDDLNDVTITTPSNNQVLTYDNGEWVNANPQAGASALDDLTDVSVSSPTSGQTLLYDSNDSEWKNSALPTPDIDDLGDVNISSLSNGQILKYDSVSQEWKNANESGGASDLDDLTDVTISSPLNGQVLKYDSVAQEWKNASGGAVSDLDDLSDVNITTPTDGQALLYDANSGEWINGTVSGGGGMNTDGSNAASTVGMSGTKVFTVGDRTGKSAAGEYAFELGDGANATGYGAIAEGIKDYANVGSSTQLAANTTVETLKETTSLTSYPYQSYSLIGQCFNNHSNIQVFVDGGLDHDEIITSGNVTVRITQDGNNIKVYYTNTDTVSHNLYYGYQGQQNIASGDYSHAEGSGTTASGLRSHTEGINTTASAAYSHAEGRSTTASNNASHAEGRNTIASGDYSHAEGYDSAASGTSSHAEGRGTKASSSNQHVSGKYNVEDTSNTYALIVGNGTNDNTRSNALALDWNGNLEAAGDVTAGNGLSIENIGEGLASILATGATNATGSTITAGTYFYLDGVLVRAKADIANGATFTLNTNYEVVTAGALNTLSYVWKLVATSTANKTYAYQLNELYSAFSLLTNDQKRSTMLVNSGGWSFPTANSQFARITSAATMQHFVIASTEANSKYRENGTDKSTTVNSSSIQLYCMEIE